VDDSHTISRRTNLRRHNLTPFPRFDRSDRVMPRVHFAMGGLDLSVVGIEP
jgi:hypothetical protein